MAGEWIRITVLSIYYERHLNNIRNLFIAPNHVAATIIGSDFK
jgi:hypothetical protein